MPLPVTGGIRGIKREKASLRLINSVITNCQKQLLQITRGFTVNGLFNLKAGNGHIFVKYWKTESVLNVTCVVRYLPQYLAQYRQVSDICISTSTVQMLLSTHSSLWPILKCLFPTGLLLYYRFLHLGRSTTMHQNMLGPPSWKAALKKKIWRSWETKDQAEHEPATGPCCKEG